MQSRSSAPPEHRQRPAGLLLFGLSCLLSGTLRALENGVEGAAGAGFPHAAVAAAWPSDAAPATKLAFFARHAPALLAHTQWHDWASLDAGLAACALLVALTWRHHKTAASRSLAVGAAAAARMQTVPARQQPWRPCLL